MKHLEVCGAILLKDNKVLCAQRNVGKYEYVSYKWEFPGGKLEPGESAKEALHRELIEEMDVHIDVEEIWSLFTWWNTNILILKCGCTALFARCAMSM